MSAVTNEIVISTRNVKIGYSIIIDIPRLANTSPAAGINAANAPKKISSIIAPISAKIALTEDDIIVKDTRSIDFISLTSTIFFHLLSCYNTYF